MSRFYLDDDDSVAIAGDYIALKVTVPPVGCENNESLVFKKTDRLSFSPSSRREVAYEPTANCSPPPLDVCDGTITPANVLRCTRHGPSSRIAFLWAGVG